MNELIRVTNALSPFTGYKGIDPKVLQHAADRGTRVHQAIQVYLETGTMWPEEMEDIAYCDSMLKMWSERPILLMEERFDDGRVTGQCDLICRHEDKTILLDWKTSSSVNRTWPLQGAAYKYLVEKNTEHRIDEVWFVQLFKTGKPAKIHVMDMDKHEDNLAIFWKCVDLYEIFFRNKSEVDFE